MQIKIHKVVAAKCSLSVREGYVPLLMFVCCQNTHRKLLEYSQRRHYRARAKEKKRKRYQCKNLSSLSIHVFESSVFIVSESMSTVEYRREYSNTLPIYNSNTTKVVDRQLFLYHLTIVRM